MDNTTRDFENREILNSLHLAEIELAVKTNMPFTQYYRTYVDTKVDLKINNKCLCPMHDETEPSFRYFTETDTFACFGKCHVAGNVIKFHEAYLKHLVNTGQVAKYNSISKLKPSNITYYTALQDLVDIIKITNLPPVFIKENEDKRVTKEELYNYFDNNPIKLNLTKEKVSISYIEKSIISNLKLIKTNYNYRNLYKRYINILTNGYDTVSNREELERLNLAIVQEVSNAH